MKYIKSAVAIALTFIIGLSGIGFAASYEIKDFDIKNIDVPEGYMSCSRDLCDEKLDKLLKSNKLTFGDWKTNVMEPNNFYIYSCNEKELGDCMYLICEQIDSPKTADGLVSHKLAEDYNLIGDGEEKTKFIDEKKKTGNLDDIEWVNPSGVTPYIEYCTTVGEDYCHCYETVYNGNRITLQFSSKKAFSDETKKTHEEVLNTLAFSETADYAEVESLIKEATQKKLEEETNSGENTKILRIIITCSFVLVIIFALLMAIRSQHKKRRSIVLRKAENEEDN